MGAADTNTLDKAELSSCTKLIIVCCHAIFVGSTQLPATDPYDQATWLLQDFQKATGTKPGEHETFLQHASIGLQLLQRGAWKNKSMLVLSGGVTNKAATALSEARSYYNAMLTASPESKAHAEEAFASGKLLLEENATDSFQNLLFSIVAFRKKTGRYPDEIGLITHAFKTRRFLELHASAIRWPRDRMILQGVDPPFSWRDYCSTSQGELERGFNPWTIDPYGTQHPLITKRIQRGWCDSTTNKLCENLDEPVKMLLRWNGGDTGTELFPEDIVLPWQST